jgi:arginine-tRNA-protein transferase
LWFGAGAGWGGGGEIGAGLAGDDVNSLFDAVPDMSPADIKVVTVNDGNRLVAASYLYVGETSTYSAFAIHDIDLHRNSLGIFTILKEIEYSILEGKSHYYLGAIHSERSYYDYKKRFHALERLDETSEWKVYPRVLSPVAPAFKTAQQT